MAITFRYISLHARYNSLQTFHGKVLIWVYRPGDGPKDETRRAREATRITSIKMNGEYHGKAIYRNY